MVSFQPYGCSARSAARYSPASSSQFRSLSALRLTSRSRHSLPRCRKCAAPSLPRTGASATKSFAVDGASTTAPAAVASSPSRRALPASGARPRATEATPRRRSCDRDFARRGERRRPRPSSYGNDARGGRAGSTRPRLRVLTRYRRRRGRLGRRSTVGGRPAKRRTFFATT